MNELNKKLYIFLVGWIPVTVILLIFSLSWGLVFNNFSFVYTIFITIPIFLLTKLLLFIPFKNPSYHRKKLHSRARAFFSCSWSFIIKGSLEAVPFLITALTTFLTVKNVSVETINECSFFNVWLCLAISLSMIISWIIISCCVRYKRQIHNNKI